MGVKIPQLQSESRERTRKLRSDRFKLAQCVRAQAPQYYQSLRDSHRIASEPRKARQLTGECARDHGFFDRRSVRGVMHRAQHACSNDIQPVNASATAPVVHLASRRRILQAQ
jgi:hypothetical protein